MTIRREKDSRSMNDNRSAANRIDWIDCAKGIGMLLVVFGHTVRVPGSDAEQLVRGAIFSFHMPLFFILSGMTFHYSEDDAHFVRNTKRAAVHLLLPALAIFLLRTAVSLFESSDPIDWRSFFVERIQMLIYSSGVDMTVNGTVIPAFGMMWFLVVLFISRSLFDYQRYHLKRSMFHVTILLCTMLGICISRLQWLSLSLDIALSVMVFYSVGEKLREINDIKNPALCLIISFAVWSVSFAIIYFCFHAYLELSCRRYPLFPLCYVTALSGTVAVVALCRMIVRFRWSKPVTILGKYSLTFFFVHAMDYLYSFVWTGNRHSFINGLLRIVVDAFITFVLVGTVIRIRDRVDRLSKMKA